MNKFMDELSVQIELIDKLNLVNFYYLFENNNSIPAAMVYYRRDRVINLSSLDPHFELLMKRLFYIYRSESTKRRIIADELTKKVLNQGFWESKIDYAGFCEGFEITDEQAYYRKNYAFATIKKPLRYLLSMLYGFFCDNAYISEISRDWCGKGEIIVVTNNESHRLIYRLSTETSAYTKIVINDAFVKNNVLTVEFFVEESGMRISFKDVLCKLSGDIIYSLKDDAVFEKVHISEDTGTVKESERKIEKTDLNEANGFTQHIFKNPECYELSTGQKILRETGDGDSFTGYLTEDDDIRYAYVISNRNIDIDGRQTLKFTNYKLAYYEPLMDKHYAVIRFEDRDKVLIKRSMGKWQS